MTSSRRRRRLATRLLVAYAVTFIALIGLVGLLGDQIARDSLRDQLGAGLAREAEALARLLPQDDLQGWVESAAGDGDLRITVIAADGEVLADSHADPASMENHADRPEVAVALAGDTGRSVRVSNTTGVEQIYMATPIDQGALRVSIPEAELVGTLSDLRTRTIAVIAVAGLLGITVVAVVARYVGSPLRRLSDTASTIANGNLEVEPGGSSIVEVDQLSRSLGAMKHELASRIDAVESERHMLESIFDVLPQGTLLISGDDEVIYANPSIHDALGDVPHRLGEVVPHRIQTMVREARRDGRPMSADLEWGTPARVLSTLATPIERDGQILVVVDDVTKPRRVDAMRRDFVANASHELKTPVASILSSLDALRIAMSRAPDRVEYFTDLIESSAQQLSRMVSDLLDLTRLESTDPSRERVALHLVIEDEAYRARDTAAEKDIDIVIDTEPIQVMGSEPDLRLAIRNLLDNAVRYTQEGGTVSVTAGVGAGKVVVSVADDGAGIASRHLPRIFERFYRVDESRTAATRGTGLGLAIVRHVVQRHGGTIEVDSELGVGSVFRMILDIESEEEEEDMDVVTVSSEPPKESN